MTNPRLPKVLLYLTAVAVLLLPLQGLAFAVSADTEASQFPCHKRSIAILYEQSQQAGSTHDCCDSTLVSPYSCTHCLVSMASFDEVTIPLQQAIYPQPQTRHEAIKPMPHKSLFKPPRVS